MTAAAFGLDFGTTNSAIACVGPDGAPALARFDSDVGPTATFRSVLYFDRDEGDARVRVRGGPQAIEGYLASDEKDGRLVQSLKSFLASGLFSTTQIFGRIWRLEDLIGALLGPMREKAEAQFGEPVTRVVVGRPVRFVHADGPEAEQLALARLTASLHNAGFREIAFEYEPVGAAYHYERGLERDELILIADFGGGTSDFSLIRVGPTYAAGGRDESILGHDGVGVAGDAFDGKIVRHLVAPQLGRGASFVSQFGQTLPVPNWIYTHLERWHHVSFLKSRKTLQLLFDLRREASEPEQLDALIQVVQRDLGFLLYRATERAKRDLSTAEGTRFELHHEDLSLERELTRSAFEGWIGDELCAIEGCLERILRRAGLEASAVDRVFLTGGSSFVPAVRRIFAQQFGEERLHSGEELTSVANGLALRALELERAR